MSKINILVVCSDRTGVAKFRSLEPHMKLQELYGDNFHVDFVIAGTDTFNWEDESSLKKFQIIHFHRTLPYIENGRIQQAYFDKFSKLINKIKSLGIITIMDIDDYWSVGREHPMYDIITKERLSEKIIFNIQNVDYVTTTTPLFASEIKKFNKNVMVLPNSIDTTEKQFTPSPEKSDKLRFGWLGGSSHYHDLTLMSDSVKQFLYENKETTQMVICGFDTRGVITETNAQTGQVTSRKIKPEESVWSKYEKLFTDDHKLLNEGIVKNLNKYSRDLDEMTNFDNQPYRRVWTKPITSYASNYNLFDVSMAPLKETKFNSMKSQLKVIEAGFHKKALIVQDFGPYKLDCINLFERGGKINENGNAILIDGYRNHSDWYKAMKKLKQNPELVTLLGENLYNTVKDKYSLDVITEKRKNFYTSLVNNKKNVEQLIEESYVI
jgi:glycosyltransferase involved in cell wall biosynthesis